MISSRGLEASQFNGSVKGRAARRKKGDRWVQCQYLVTLFIRSIFDLARYSRASVPSQVLNGVLLDRLGLHVQVCPRLDTLAVDTDHGLETGSLGLFPTGRNVLSGRLGRGRGVVNVLSDDLVRADGRPPERPVDNVGDEHGDGFREDGSGVRFQGKGLDELDEVRVGVGSGSGKGKRGSNRCLGRTEHDSQRLSDVQHMGGTSSSLTVVQVEQGGVSYRARASRIVNREVLLIRSCTTRLTCHGIQQPILSSKQRTGPSDGGSGESLPDGDLSLVLGPVKGRFGIRLGVEVRDVDQPRDAVLVSDLGDLGSSTVETQQG